MGQLILISHGKFCTELKRSAEMIMGPQAGITTVELLPSEGPEDFKAKFEAAIDGLTGFTVLADLAGGTPCNVATKELLSGKDFDLYAGMNLPMVISFINTALIGGEPILVQEATEGIVDVKAVLAAMDDEDED